MKDIKCISTVMLAVCIILYTSIHIKAEVRIAEHNEITADMDTQIAAESRVGAEPQTVTEPQLMAQSAVLIDGDTGRVLFGKKEATVLPMASTTKIMTCILALENSSPDDVVSISDYAASMPDVQLNMRKGETYRMEDLLYSLMLESHNDSAVAIAEYIGGSVERFAEMMNQKARDIGCMNTYFVTPNGLDGTNRETGKKHATTAEELAQIMRYCISQSPKREKFLEITRAPSRAFSNLERTRSFSCINHNVLLTSMEGAISGKTGFTNGAGYCYIGAVKKGEKTFIAALLACGWPPHKTYKWQDMRKLISYGNTAYDFFEIINKDIDLEPVSVENGIEETTELTVRYPKERSLRILMRADEPVRIKKQVVKRMKAPVEAGVAAGQVDYYVGEALVASYPIVTTAKVGLWDMKFCAKTLLKQFLFCYNEE